MNIYLLRHGETEENRNKFYYGKMDVSLNENGVLQGKKAGQFLGGMEFDEIFISERKRTRETVEAAFGRKDLEFIIDKRINEMDFGKFEGLDYKEIQKNFPKEYEMWNRNWKEFSPPEGESYKRFYNRVKSFMDELVLKEKENILITTHGGVIRTIYCYVLGGNMDSYWKFASKNGDISIVKFEYGNLFIDSITHI